MENHFKLLAAFAGLLVLSSPAAAAKFTGAGIFASDSGGSTNLLYWNTRGGDLSFNLYLKQGGGWLNSGNGAGASINIPLGLGSRTYLIFGQTGLAAQTYVGMNLFFEGDDDTPLISGLMATNTYSPLGLNVIPNSSGSTRTLRGNALVAGANTLEFTAVGLTVELAAFSWYTPASAPAAGDTQTA
ncbi:MAG: hypothetical protein NTY38_07890, partial [Acidobacteria bacterium]|nr:hypothetical protein [Acidobacteriota bacterium]